MAIRAPSSPGCGFMHSTPTSAFSRASSMSGGASLTGRGPKSSSSNPVTLARRSSSAKAILAATAELGLSAISATCSPGWTARHVSTAFRAPGIRSGCTAPNPIRLFYRMGGLFGSGRSYCNHAIASRKRRAKAQHLHDCAYNGARGPLGRRLGAYTKGGDLAAAAGDVGEAGGAEAGEEAAQFSAEEIWSEIDEHVFELYAAGLRDVGKNLAADGDAFLHDPAAGISASVPGRDGPFDRGVPVF